MKAKCKGIAVIAIVIGVMAASVIIGALSVKFLGPNNVVEEEMEGIINHTLDAELHVPEGTFDVDFTPGAEE